MFLPRSVSCRRFGVTGKRPDPLQPEFLEAVQRHCFKQLGTDSVEPETVGWVSYNNFLETAPQLDELLLGRYLRLGLRERLRHLQRDRVLLELPVRVCAGLHRKDLR